MDGAHLRRQDGVALVLHLLGVAHLLEGGALGLAVHGRAARQVRVTRVLQRAVGQVHALRRHLGHQAGRSLALQLRALLLQGRHERAHANARGTQVGDLVNLQHGVDLAGLLQNLLHLVGGQGVQAAAKGLKLNEVKVVAGGHEARRAVQAAVVHPLVNHANGPLGLHLVGHGVLRQHGEAKAVQHLGNCVVDLAVVVVGAARQHDAVGVVLLYPAQGVVTGLVHGLLEGLVLGPCCVHGLVHLAPGQVRAGEAAVAGLRVRLALRLQNLEQALLQVVLLVVRHEGVQVLHVGGGQLVNVQAQRLRVAHDDGAVVVVGGTVVLLALPAHAGHPDEVRVLLQQVHDVAVGELGRVAHGL